MTIAQPGNRPRRGVWMFAVLHPAFALTGVVHAIGGALLPSIASSFHLTDAQSGSLFFWYFLGTSLGALFCVRHYARLMSLGFMVAAVICGGIANASVSWLGPLFLLLGWAGYELWSGRAAGSQQVSGSVAVQAARG